MISAVIDQTQIRYFELIGS